MGNMPFCTNCGERIHGKFCNKCGTPAEVAVVPQKLNEEINPMDKPLPVIEPPRQPEKRSGCFKGCLIGLLVMILLTLFGGGIVFNVLKSVLEGAISL